MSEMLLAKLYSDEEPMLRPVLREQDRLELVSGGRVLGGGDLYSGSSIPRSHVGYTQVGACGSRSDHPPGHFRKVIQQNMNSYQ